MSKAPTDPPFGETERAAHASGPSVAPSDHSALLRTWTSFAQSMLRQNSLEDLLWDIAQNIGHLLGFEDCVVYLAEDHGLVQYAAFGIKNSEVRQIRNPIVLPYGSGIVGAVFDSRRPERVADCRADPRYIADEFHGRSELTVPITFEDRVIGVLDSESSRLDGFNETDEAMFIAIATLAAPRIASALAERERHRAERALQDAEAEHRRRERLLHEERLASLGDLAGGLAHDFNNLLTAILGNVSLAREDLGGPLTEELLGEAENACRRARSLTKQLLTFARGGAPVKEIGDLGTLLRESVQFALRGSAMVPQFDLPDDLLAAEFDNGQMAQVFHNLAINAVQASECGTLRVRAENKQIEGKPWIELQIHDEGPGIPTEIRSRVFDPYFTTKTGGTGLGLATAFWAVRRHHGRLSLDPNVTRGACFVLELPATHERPVPSTPARPKTAQQTRRLLVMEDEESVRRVLVQMLERLGHQVEAVADGDACIQTFQSSAEPFDAVLLDLTIPGGMSGDETLRRLRDHNPDVIALVTSGYSHDPVLADYRRYGFRARLEKPFTSKNLERALGKAFGG